MTVHFKNRFQIAHLLEHGHAKRGDGRVAAITRIYRLRFQRDIYKDLSALDKCLNKQNPD